MSPDLLVAAGRLRTVLVGGFLAGVCVFFAPLAVLALGLLAAYLNYVASDASGPLFGLERPPDAADFRAGFAPAAHAPAALAAAGGGGGGRGRRGGKRACGGGAGIGQAYRSGAPRRGDATVLPRVRGDVH